jgi:hypothetical protein
MFNDNMKHPAMFNDNMAQTGAPSGRSHWEQRLQLRSFLYVCTHFCTLPHGGVNWRSHVQRQHGTPCHVQRQHGTNWRSQWALPLETTPPTALIFVRLYSFLHTPPRWSYSILLGCDHAFSLLEVRHGRLTNHSTNKKVNYWLPRYTPATLLLDLR